MGRGKGMGEVEGMGRGKGKGKSERWKAEGKAGSEQEIRARTCDHVGDVARRTRVPITRRKRAASSGSSADPAKGFGGFPTGQGLACGAAGGLIPRVTVPST